MTAKQQFDAGQVSAAAETLAARLREYPTDIGSRTFLFEILCFSGQYERAGKHLSLLAQSSKEAEMGAVLYYSALHAEKTRHELFRTEEFPSVPAGPSPAGTLNGKPFKSIEDEDPTIGARLEVFAAGAYLWIPFRHIASVEMREPQKLRDTLWSPAFVVTGPEFKGTDIGEVLIPVTYPFSWKSDDQSVWLGRTTEWVADDGGHEYPVGQKVFLVDGEEVPLLSIRSLEFTADASS